MTTSVHNFPTRLTKIDDLTREDHSYLTEDDTCYYLGEYTARAGYAFSYTNDLILNFKKSMDRREKPEWRYKEWAINAAAAAFHAALDDRAFARMTFVPVPPSKAKDHEMYDDRVFRMLLKIRPNPQLDVRELLVQTQSTDAFHETDQRPSPEGLEALYEIDDSQASRQPIESLAVVDDLLTTGAHFRAAETVLSARFPGTEIIGLFIARRAPDTSDPL